MLQRILFEPLDELQGTWTRERLLEMDGRFVAAVETAVRAGDESLVAARATYLVNGKQHTGDVIEAAWKYFLVSTEEGRDVSFGEILGRCPGVNPHKVRTEFRRRLTSWIRGIGQTSKTHSSERSEGCDFWRSRPNKQNVALPNARMRGSDVWSS
jgi:hypothetical protein